MHLPINLEIQDSFYKEEEICGHQVSEKEKKIWAIELDLLSEFKRVCEKYNLQWFIAYGSLIGAIRHKGFIPWDNDVDVWMPRADFDKLNEIASAEFSDRYFWQTPITEQGRYFQDFAKLRNSDTTCYCEDLMLQGINYGIYIDIFVLDAIPDSDFTTNILLRKANFYSHFTRFLSPYPRKDQGIKWLKHLFWKFIRKIFLHNCKGDYIFTKINEIYRSAANKPYKKVAYMGECSKKFDKHLFEKVVWKPFEMIEVPVPKGYDEILRQEYGNYMQFPPIGERETHAYFDFAPEVPYSEYKH